MAARFSVSKSLVQKLVKQQRTEGNLEPKKRGKPQFSYLTNARETVTTLVEENSDSTLVEFCELFAQKTGNWVSRSAMGRFLNKLGFSRKKKTTRSSQASTERVQKLRVEYWEKLKHIKPDNLVFLDETGMLLGGNRDYARSQKGTRTRAEKPFYRGACIDYCWCHYSG